MGFDGAGNFTRTDGVRTGATTWQQAQAATVNIEADDHDVHDEDIASGLSNCITKDGQTVIEANIPMNSKKFTGLAAGSANGDSVRYEQVSGALNELTWAPTYTPSSGTFGTVTTNLAKYFLDNSILEIYLDFFGTFSGVTDHLNVTLPVEIGQYAVTLNGYFVVASTDISPSLLITYSSATSLDLYAFSSLQEFQAAQYNFIINGRLRRL